MDAPSQRPLELILARNLLSSLSTPAFLVNLPGDVIFYNEAAGALLGRRFEETGTMSARDWVDAFGPLDDDGQPIPVEDHAPGPETTRYGGNTSCVELALDDGSVLVLDGGTGIRSLGLTMSAGGAPVNILLTHLHLDHIQGLMFFAPMFRPQSEIVIWGPAAPEGSLEDRIARYISAPLSPVEVRELPCHPSFREATTTEWRIGSATVRAASVAHRGPTLAYRVEADGTSVCYIPDHEPGLGAELAQLDEDWISGLHLARDASLLIHDCQYTDDEYADHAGWGHSGLSDALLFGHRAAARRLLLFHHDPLHGDDFLDALGVQARERAAELGRPPGWVGLAAESQEIAVVPAPDSPAAVG